MSETLVLKCFYEGRPFNLGATLHLGCGLTSERCILRLSSPHRGIALAAMLPSQPTSPWVSAARVQIEMKIHRIAKVVSAMHIALHKSLVSVPFRALTSHDSYRGLQKYIASQTCIARFGELSSANNSPFQGVLSETQQTSQNLSGRPPFNFCGGLPLSTLVNTNLLQAPKPRNIKIREK